MDLVVTRMNLVKSATTKTLCFFDIGYGEIVIKGFKLVNGSQGIFVSNPREKSSKSDQWYDTIRFTNPILEKKVEILAMEEYKKMISENKSDNDNK